MKHWLGRGCHCDRCFRLRRLWWRMEGVISLAVIIAIVGLACGKEQQAKPSPSVHRTSWCDPHPELRGGEAFWGNMADLNPDMPYAGRDMNGLSEWDLLALNTKRRGEIAYDTGCNPIRDMFPVFVQRKELTDKGGDPDKLWHSGSIL